jgi:heterodisulfide reductase subunit A
MNAALSLSGQGYETHLVERDKKLGGNALKLRVTSQGEDIHPYLDKLTSKVESDPSIRVYKGATIKDVDGFVGNFRTTITSASGDEVVEHGAAIIATGAGEHRPDEYAYGSHPMVMTHLELDQALSAGTIMPRSIKSAVFIQCVGSREPERMYCSKVCCTHTAKTALHFKKENPDCRVFVLYRDIRTHGENELLYREARSKGVLFIRFDLDRKPVVDPEGDGLKVTVYDKLIGCELTIRTDMVALASAIVSNRDEDLAMMYKVPLDGDGWFLEAHQKLRPVDFANDGVFMAGLAHYPKSVEEAITQAQAAVSRAVTVLSRSELSLSGTVAFIDRTKCVGCGVCWTVCPFKAITQDDKGLAVINDALCKGCGNCATSCRSGAANLRGFSNQDVMAQIEAAA